MKLQTLPYEFSVCMLESLSGVDFSDPFCFFARTDEEISLVCRSEKVPPGVVDQNGGWRAFRVEGVLDFSLTGILAGIARVLAEEKIGIVAISTFQTDYVLAKAEDFDRACKALAGAGYWLGKWGTP